MAERTATVTIDAPVHQVYMLYTHFNDYPKFMSFVREVTYLDDQRSHWVVDVVGRHEWDAVNENWTPDREIGWRSVDGLENTGRVTFAPVGDNKTQVTVAIQYVPPGGALGNLGEALGAGGVFERRLQQDLDHFARMVHEAPPGALDPNSSAYLFHADSAAARGDTTIAQNESMGIRNDAPAQQPVPSTTTAVDDPLNDPTVPRVPGTSAGPPDLS